MILYFIDRKLDVLGQASTGLPGGPVLSNDKKSEDVETGVALFECKLHFNKKTRAKAEEYAQVGNYILRNNGEEDEFYTIIESELDTKKQTIYIYAEDAGLDLINEVVGEYEADKAYPITHYFDRFAYDSGFRIGTNQAAGLTKKLAFDSEETVTARLASVAAQFDGCEISYKFKIEGLRITDKVINFHKKRGQDHGVTLRLNTDIDNIIVSKTIANLATALRAKGGTPDNADDPITLRGYIYDDGDFYIDGDCLKSRKALEKWSRYLNPNEPNQKEGHEGHIVRLFSYDTVSKETLCNETIAELKKVCDMEINYDAEIKNLKGAKIGDRINIVDEAGKLYLSTRLLSLETSVEQQEIQAVLGEHLIKDSGISAKVAAQAAEFALQAQATKKALEAAKAEAVAAMAAAANAQTAADNAQSSVDNVEIGGRNLLQGTFDLTADVATINADGKKASNIYSGAMCAYSTAAWTGIYIDLAAVCNRVGLLIGDTVTFSIMVMAEADTTNHFYFFRATNGTTADKDFGELTLSAGVWYKLTATITINEYSLSSSKARFEFGVASDVNICFAAPKAEKGNMATDWTPAPEDMATVDEVAGIEVGGTNLLLNSKTIDGDNIATAMEGGISGTYKELNVYSYDNSAATEGSRDIILFKQIFPEKLGAVYTLSFYAKGSGTLRTYFYGETGYLQCSKTVQSNGDTGSPGDGSSAWELTDTWTRYWVTWTLKDEGDITIAKYVLFRLYYGGAVDLCGFKLEKGNKATDWTPAPEDVENSINNSTESLNNTIAEQHTSLVEHSNSAAQSVRDACVEKVEYEENKEAVQSQLKIQGAQIETNFNATNQQINLVNEDLQEVKNQYGRHISFSDDTAISITTSDGKVGIDIDPVTGLVLKNDGEIKSKLVGDEFYTGNMVVEVSKRAQFGPIAFVPRSDGSLAVLKVK